MSGSVTSRRAFLHPQAVASVIGAGFADVLPPLQDNHSDYLLRAGREAMACRFEILFGSGDRLKVMAAHRALDEVARLERQMTVFSEQSEISSINRNAHRGPVAAEPRLFQLLRLGRDLCRKTEEAFDMTAGPLWRCWGFAQRQGEVPTPEALNHALDSVGSHLLELEEESRAVRFHHPDLELNLGGIGKGYALDRAAALLRDEGLSNALLHAGHSSILALGNAPGPQAGGGWPLSLRHPLQRTRSLARIRLRNRAMATSGVGEQSFRAEGKRYGHVLDPRTGYPTEKNLSATAFARTAAEADALSTAFLVMDLEEVREYCQNDPDMGALLVPTSGSAEIEVHRFGLDPDEVEIVS